MNLTIRVLAIAVSLLCADAILGHPVIAQDSEPGIRRGGLTEGVISRGQLRRLLDQSPADRNPLRQQNIRPAPTIIDPNVQATAWQEEAAAAEPANPVPQSDQPTSDEQPAPIIGPAPSPKMLERWAEMGMLVEIGVNKLLEEIEQRRTKINASIGFDNEGKTERLKHLEIAETAAHQANQHVSEKDKYQKDITSLDKNLDELRRKAKLPTEAPVLDESIPVDQIRTKLRNLQAELDLQKSNLRKIGDLIQHRDDRMTAIPSQRSESLNSVNVLHQELLQKQASGSNDFEELLSIRARELAASTQVQKLDEEAHWHDLSLEKLPLEKSIYQRNIQRLEQEINAWNDHFAKRKQLELEQQIAAARQKAWQTHPSLRAFSEETTELAQSRVKLAEQINKLQDEKLKVENQNQDVDQHLTRLEGHEESLQKGGNEQSNNALIEVHRNLIRPWESMARIRILESKLIQNQGSKLKLTEQLDQISDPATFIREHLEITKDENVADTTLVAMAETAIESHRKQLVALVDDHEEVNGLLNQIKTSRESMLEEIAKTREFIDTYALWVQSADPLDMQVLHKSQEGAIKFFDNAEWDQLGKSIVGNVKRHPWEPAVGMVGLFVAFLVGRRFKG